MKKKKITSVLMLLLAAVMLFTACSSGNSTNNNQKNNDSGQPSNTSEPGKTEGPGDPLGKYDPPIKVTSVTSIMSGSTEADMDDNLINQYYRDHLGIDLSYQWAVIGDQYDQRINLMLTSGDLPDMMRVNLRQMYQMVEAGLLEDMTGAWDNYASELTVQSTVADGTASLDMATIDGKLYGIPLITPVADSAHSLYIREDWRKKLNLPEPKTYADLEQIMRAFATQDPNGDGSKTYGLNITKDLYTNGFDITSFANMFHAYPNAWVEGSDGKLVYGSVQPEMKDALAKLQSLFQEGLIDREFTVRDEERAGEAVLREQVGAFFGVQWTHWIAGGGVDLYKNDPESEWKVYPIPSVDNNPAQAIAYDNTDQFMVVRKGFKHPEAAVKMLNWINVMGQGPQPIPYEEWQTLWENWGYALIRPETIHANMNRWLNTFEALETGDTSKVEQNYLNLEQYNDISKFVEEGEQLRVSELQEDKDWAAVRWGWMLSGEVFKIANEYRQSGNLKVDKIGAFISPTMIERQGVLDQLEVETFTRIITGDSSIDAFDSFVDEWKKLGGDSITNELNDWYKQ